MEGELGSFLRSRREAVSPAEVGLPEGPRRRTPGLRRAELATLAGVSVDYLIRLEQGRDTHPSTQVLAALAEALRLSDDDREYLWSLAVISNGGTELCCPQAKATARTVRPTVQAILDQLDRAMGAPPDRGQAHRGQGVVPPGCGCPAAGVRDPRAPRCRLPATGGPPAGRRGDVDGARSAHWSPARRPAIRERRLAERFAPGKRVVIGANSQASRERAGCCCCTGRSSAGRRSL